VWDSVSDLQCFCRRVLVTTSSSLLTEAIGSALTDCPPTSTRCYPCEIFSKVTCSPGCPCSPLMGDAGQDGVLLPCDQLHAPKQWTLPEHQRSFPWSAMQKHRRRITGNIAYFSNCLFCLLTISPHNALLATHLACSVRLDWFCVLVSRSLSQKVCL